MKPAAASEGPGAPELESIAQLRQAVDACRRCALWRHATQGVPGEGPKSAELMLVGEAPGDAEDIAGHPFVGPAGALLDRALEQAGIDRTHVFVSNAVKHFKFERRGKRRLHARPNATEIKACKWWLDQELRLVAPKLIIALGATAARSLFGRTVTIAAVRGKPMPLGAGDPVVFVTVHPSYLLRIPHEEQRREEYQRFVRELRRAADWLKRAG